VIICQLVSTIYPDLASENVESFILTISEASSIEGFLNDEEDELSEGNEETDEDLNLTEVELAIKNEVYARPDF